MPVLYVVLPCYNEKEVLPETVHRLSIKLNDLINKGVIDHKSRMLLVDDGSKDITWQLIEEYHEQNELVCGLKLAHNRGHQKALYAGLMTAKEHADCVISMDADLQDDINVIDGFLEKFADGCDVVFGVRSKRDTDTAFKRLTAEGYYKVLDTMGVDVVFNHADCRLMSRRALEELGRYREVNLFLRGMVKDLGFKSDVVYYERAERFAGESKYPLKKMLMLAWDGITSFSVSPLKLITTLGAVISILALLGMAAGVVLAICSLPCSLCFILSSVWLACGILLLALGIVASYVGKLYVEVKDRPRYASEKTLIK